ncbi:hypothetical protein RHSIM_Rhsim10G0177500 [Rhododendron simsii]|uniref:Uncharacterized protein n=1 Tax=Rhododendron simsii TaxID=118357 RepID=A0A834LDZ7_RHOSS|nr:hypothetical protein RHSIM_Rhsim10G0177500 [Rhododendron simsii]
MAHQVASQGARVSILARGRDKLEEAQRAIRLATGIDVSVFSADARDFEAVKAAVGEAGPINVLLCNQGVFVPSELVIPIFAEEKKRPPLTSIIAASSGAMKADEVAKKALDGIKSGSFFVPCNFEGILLAVATAGLSPQRSLLMAFVEVVAARIARTVALCFQWI